MKSKSGIAAQALAAAALAAVVYFAFIAPNGTGPLTSIEVEGGPPVATAPPGPVAGENERRQQSAPIAATAPAAELFSPPSGPSPNSIVQTPPSSQYEDPVARILNQVHSAR